MKEASACRCVWTHNLVCCGMFPSACLRFLLGSLALVYVIVSIMNGVQPMLQTTSAMWFQDPDILVQVCVHLHAAFT